MHEEGFANQGKACSLPTGAESRIWLTQKKEIHIPGWVQPHPGVSHWVPGHRGERLVGEEGGSWEALGDICVSHRQSLQA